MRHIRILWCEKIFFWILKKNTTFAVCLLCAFVLLFPYFILDLMWFSDFFKIKFLREYWCLGALLCVVPCF